MAFWVLALGLVLTSPGLAQELAPTARPAETAEELTFLAVINNYAQIVGGAVAAAAAILGLPLLLQNYRKTRAEIERIELESAQIRAGLTTRVLPEDKSAEAFNLNIEGDSNAVQITADPRLSGPLILLVDVFIGFFYYQLASLAVSILPIYPLDNAIHIAVFAVVFIPIFRAARNLKRDWGPLAFTSVKAVQAETRAPSD
ncbi:hypothetical protein PYH37_002797 [Sinorhizobium numidicum]|uniref:Uncharacterized protein n=1 Tax=Sinorhizobium numidicum TaxID=680248 RepID=A0ABY8D153_9HYPH|nr:hypothetical protein [Sinorhizobium numidicum]WEX77955.1 hypothetical protein PYH37_002797 [Sinorhizobium numidicum]WEX84614.1 hypothetical protein PYH38_003510 [Sinorhizobium numidicum]